LSGDTYTWNKLYIREGLSYYDPLVYSSVGGYRRHYLYDGLGSTRQLLNDAQTTTDQYSYEAFGNLLGSTGSTSNPYKYVGSLGYYQTGCSLQHLGLRYYMPEVGRFLTQDPVRGTRWDPQSLHRYSYVSNCPPSHMDPSGLSKASCRAGCWALYILCVPFSVCGYDCEGFLAFCLADCDKKWTVPDWVPICNHSRDPQACCEALGQACRINDYYPDVVCNQAEKNCKAALAVDVGE